MLLLGHGITRLIFKISQNWYYNNSGVFGQISVSPSLSIYSGPKKAQIIADINTGLRTVVVKASLCKYTIPHSSDPGKYNCTNTRHSPTCVVLAVMVCVSYM